MKTRHFLLVLFATFFLAACPSKKSSEPRGYVSTNPVYPGGGTNPGGSYSMAECTRSATSGLAIISQASTHYSGYMMDQDKILLNLTQAPSEILNDNTYSIKFYRWKELQQGQAQVNETPTSFYFKHKSTGSLIGSMTELSKDYIEQAIDDSNLNNITPSNFFDHFYILFIGVDYQWQAITMALYQGTGEAITSADVLLPPFYADPNYYNQVTKSTRLKALHPLKQYVGSGSNYNYKQMADNICYEMLGQRTVASEESLWSQFLTSVGQLFKSMRGFLGYFFGL